MIINQLDAHYAQAVEVGTETAIAIKDEDHGGRIYSCLDPEGHIWNFSSYDPWSI